MAPLIVAQTAAEVPAHAAVLGHVFVRQLARRAYPAVTASVGADVALRPGPVGEEEIFVRAARSGLYDHHALLFLTAFGVGQKVVVVGLDELVAAVCVNIFGDGRGFFPARFGIDPVETVGRRAEFPPHAVLLAGGQIGIHLEQIAARGPFVDAAVYVRIAVGKLLVGFVEVFLDAGVNLVERFARSLGRRVGRIGQGHFAPEPRLIEPVKAAQQLRFVDDLVAAFGVHVDGRHFLDDVVGPVDADEESEPCHRDEIGLFVVTATGDDLMVRVADAVGSDLVAEHHQVVHAASPKGLVAGSLNRTCVEYVVYAREGQFRIRGGGVEVVARNERIGLLVEETGAARRRRAEQERSRVF